MGWGGGKMGHLTLRRLEILLCSSCAGRINRGLLLSGLGAMAIRDCQKMGASGSLAARPESSRNIDAPKEGTATSC